MQPAFDKEIIAKEFIAPGEALHVFLDAAPRAELAGLGEFDHPACCGIKADIVLGSVSVLEAGDAADESLDFKLCKYFNAATSGGSLVGAGPCARTPARA